MDPDGDYESRHSIKSTGSTDLKPSTTLDPATDDGPTPHKIFAPSSDDVKPPTKSAKSPPSQQRDAYDGPTAPPMEPAAAPASNNSNNRSTMEPRGIVYEQLMRDKMDLAPSEDDEAPPVSNSVAVPIGFNSEDIPEAKALPIVSCAMGGDTETCHDAINGDAAMQPSPAPLTPSLAAETSSTCNDPWANYKRKNVICALGTSLHQ